MKCASVKISLSSTSVLVGSYLQIKLVEMDPPCCASGFDKLFVRAVLFGGYTNMLAKYDKALKRFILADPVPSIYQGRLVVSGHEVLLNSVKFDDERTRFYMQYYYDQSWSFVESRYLELKTVYGR